MVLVVVRSSVVDGSGSVWDGREYCGWLWSANDDSGSVSDGCGNYFMILL